MKKEKPAVLLGRRIKSLRRSKNLTQEELGSRCGINYKYIGGIERGEENPSLSSLQKIAEGLGIDIIDLFRFHHEETDPTKLRALITNLIKHISDKDVEKLKCFVKFINILD